ncbi:MAG TPA: hypothetical protein VGB77_09365 [Abditibacteriaceae bacterium]|jgi:hypothetical protein
MNAYQSLLEQARQNLKRIRPRYAAAAWESARNISDEEALAIAHRTAAAYMAVEQLSDAELLEAFVCEPPAINPSFRERMQHTMAFHLQAALEDEGAVAPPPDGALLGGNTQFKLPRATTPGANAPVSSNHRSSEPPGTFSVCFEGALIFALIL